MGMKPVLNEPAGPSPANVNTSGSNVPGHYASVANCDIAPMQSVTTPPNPANAGGGTNQKGPIPGV